MPEFLKDFVSGVPAVSPLELAIRLVAALLGGIIVSRIYRATRPDLAIAPSFPGTLVLLSVLIAMATGEPVKTATLVQWDDNNRQNVPI